MELTVGQDLAAGPRRTGFAEWNRYAAVNDEFVPIHMDDDAGRRAGYTGAIAMGRLQWSYVHRMLRDLVPAEGGSCRSPCGSGDPPCATPSSP